MKEIFSELLKEKRNAKNLTQEDVARELGTTAVAYGHYERGSAYPESNRLMELSKILDFDFLNAQNMIAEERRKNKNEKQRQAVMADVTDDSDYSPQAQSRRYNILVTLMKRGAMKLSDFCIGLNTPKSIIEKDIKMISEETSAIFYDDKTSEIFFLPFLPGGQSRSFLASNILSKRALAKYAIAHFLQHKSVVYIDGGSTTSILMMELTKNDNQLAMSNCKIEVLTNNLHLLQIYRLAENNVIETFEIIGGKYDITRSLLMTDNLLKAQEDDENLKEKANRNRFSRKIIDVAFITPDFICENKMTTLYGYANMKRAIIKLAKKIIFLAVSSKFVSQQENPPGDVLISFENEDLETIGDYSILAPQTSEIVEEKKRILPQKILNENRLVLVPLETTEVSI